MWTYENSIETAASAEAIFEILRDVSRWHEWNQGVERIDLDGPFATGTAGVMVIPDQGSLSFRLAWVGQARGLEDETEIPDAEVVVRVATPWSRWRGAGPGSPTGRRSRDRRRT